MKLRTEVEIKPITSISYGQKTLFIGSCFSENIGSKMQEGKMLTSINPGGTLYSPGAILQLLCSNDKGQEIESNIFEEHGIWRSWNHHSKIASTNKEKLLADIIETQNTIQHFLLEGDVIFITFGTAFQYELKMNKKVVANCHKMPADIFDKKILQLESALTQWAKFLNKSIADNPKLKFIFTVSPVRHIRDGIIENTKSKAILIQLVHRLVESFEQVHYFPAFEIMMDDLRDYRFYGKDLVHPSGMAVDYIWKKFMGAFFSKQDQSLYDAIMKIKASFNHRPRFPETVQHQRFLEQTIEKARQLEQSNPKKFQGFDEEIKLAEQQLQTFK